MKKKKHTYTFSSLYVIHPESVIVVIVVVLASLSYIRTYKERCQ